MIIRSLKKQHNFTILDNTCPQDARLSYQARGLHTYVMTKPADWEVRLGDLVKNSPHKEEAVRNMLKELSKCGYAQLIKERGTGGRVVGSRWDIFETCNVPDRQGENRHLGELPTLGFTEPRSDRHSVKPTSGKTPPIVSTDLQQITELQLRTEREKVTPAPGKTADLSQKGETQKAPQFRAAPQLFADCQYANISTTAWRDALQELCLDLPADLDTNYYFERVRDWSEESGKTSANWLKTAARFAHDDAKKSPSKVATLSNNSHASQSTTPPTTRNNRNKPPILDAERLAARVTRLKADRAANGGW